MTMSEEMLLTNSEPSNASTPIYSIPVPAAVTLPSREEPLNALLSIPFTPAGSTTDEKLQPLNALAAI